MDRPRFQQKSEGGRGPSEKTGDGGGRVEHVKISIRRDKKGQDQE